MYSFCCKTLKGVYILLAVNAVCKQLGQGYTSSLWFLITFCVLPNHVHLTYLSLFPLWPSSHGMHGFVICCIGLLPIFRYPFAGGDMDSVHVAQTEKVNHGLARVDGRVGKQVYLCSVKPIAWSLDSHQWAMMTFPETYLGTSTHVSLTSVLKCLPAFHLTTCDIMLLLIWDQVFQ